MPESLLTILKFCFLALLYLFFFRVLRAVWVEVSGRPAVVASAAPAGASRGGSAQPAAKSGTKLRVVEPSDRRGRTYELADELTLGRAVGCQITLDDDTFVSQLHARLFRRDGQLFVEDLGSTNGTFLNRKKVGAPSPLKRGDHLQVGKTVMELV
jgi:pSer/pThr/pTyr-binding forkhead associated (FHA) protein